MIANVGGTDGDKGAGIVAFNAETGAVMWTATNHEASYSSPVGATFGGKRTAVFFTRQRSGRTRSGERQHLLSAHVAVAHRRRR